MRECLKEMGGQVLRWDSIKILRKSKEFPERNLACVNFGGIGKSQTVRSVPEVMEHEPCIKSGSAPELNFRSSPPRSRGRQHQCYDAGDNAAVDLLQCHPNRHEVSNLVC